MLRERIVDALTQLHLAGMKSAYDELMAGVQKRGHTPEKFLWSLLEAEMTERDGRSLRYRLGQAHFPVQKELETFDFSASPVDASAVTRLCQGDFVEAHANVVFAAVPAAARPTWRQPLGCRLCADARRCAFSTRWI